MAVAIRNTHLCERCHLPIRRTDDQVRILRIGITASAHWRCFITAMRESEQRTAEVVSEEAR